MEFLKDFFDFSHTYAKELLISAGGFAEIFGGLGGYILKLFQKLPEGFVEIKPNVFVHETAVVSQSAYLGENVIVGAFSEIRHCAFIRGNALIGENCVVGNSSEVKNSILFDGVQIPHFNYAGDSILGRSAHLGAGAIISNLKSDKSTVFLRTAAKTADTGLKKFGAIVGDFAEIGCNSVLNPGTVIGKNASVYPLSCVRGFVPRDCIYKSKTEIIKKNRR